MVIPIYVRFSVLSPCRRTAGNSDIELDKNTLDRVQEVTKLTDNEKNHIYITLDALIRDFKAKKAYAH